MMLSITQENQEPNQWIIVNNQLKIAWNEMAVA
jgi:hypothetical protein